MAGADEVAGDDLGALVDELVEGVLAVRAGLAPDDRAGLVIGDLLAVAIHGLAVGLHVALLEVGREAGHVLVVREDGLGLVAVEVVVPDADEGEDHGDVLLKRGGAEVLVVLIAAL